VTRLDGSEITEKGCQWECEFCEVGCQRLKAIGAVLGQITRTLAVDPDQLR
jgi:hypothetical protein